MSERTVRDVKLSGSTVDLHDWEAWSIDADATTIAAAPRFGAPGGVEINLATGRVEPRGDALLLDADRPLWWLPAERGIQDPGAHMTFVLPPDDDSGAGEALHSNGAGVLTRLVRGRTGIRLQVWHRTSALTWSASIDPVPDTAGIALAPSGEAVALVASTARGPITLRVYDAHDGAVKWNQTSMLTNETVSPVWQPVGFSDDGTSVWLAGGRGARTIVEKRAVADGALGATIEVAPVPARGSAGYGAVTAGLAGMRFWIATASYNPGGDGRPPPHWITSYALFAPGRRVDTAERDDDLRAIFDENRGEDSRVRVMRATTGGGIVLVQAKQTGLRVTTWKTPPGG